MKNIMKKTWAIIVAALIFALVSATCVMATPAENPYVYVSVADKDGKLVLAWEKIELYDKNGDGGFDIDEALYSAHEKSYEGGAAAGYASSQSEWGLSIVKLWGTENGGGYGYYVNNNAASSLSDKVKSGDRIYAYVYTDLTSWSDTYSFFDVDTIDAKKGDTVTLTLSGAGYDSAFNPVTNPVSGAIIVINGNETEYKTDENGKAEIKLDKAGDYIISAKSAEMMLVPPVISAHVEAGTSMIVYIVIAVVAIGVVGAVITVTAKNKKHE